MEKLAPDDFACFARAVLKDEETAQNIAIAPHQLEWFDHVEACRRDGKYAGILAPPSSGKSAIFAIGYPLWSIGRDQNLRACLCAEDADLAKKRIRPAKDYLERDVDYRSIFKGARPGLKAKWTEYEFTVKRAPGIKDPSFQGRGIESPPHGSRIGLLVNDDVCSYANTIAEPAMRQKVIDYWLNGFATRLSPGSFVVHIGGVVHSRDLNNRLIADPRFRFLKQSISSDFEAIEQENLTTGERKRLPLWGRAWSPEFLREACAADPRSFNRAYRHVGYTDDERTFEKEAVQASIRRGPREIPAGAPRFIGVDLSGRSRPGNVIFTIALIGTRRVVVEIDFGAWSSDQTARKIIATAKKHRPTAIVVENNAYQQALLDWLSAIGGDPLPLEPFTTGRQKADQVLGIPGLSVEFKNGMWELPIPDEHGPIAMGCKCGTCELIAQLEEHPFGVSDHIMAAWFARFGAMKYGPDAQAHEFVQGKAPTREGRREDLGRRVSRLDRFRRSRG